MPSFPFSIKTARILLSLSFMFFCSASFAQSPRTRVDFDNGWRFNLGDVKGGEEPGLNDVNWRTLNLPHDWSIEGKFSKDNPATPEGGALPGGIGWYRKTFLPPSNQKNKKVIIQFNGVYMNADVWLNGIHLGNHPYGYTSFYDDITNNIK